MLLGVLGWWFYDLRIYNRVISDKELAILFSEK